MSKHLNQIKKIAPNLDIEDFLYWLDFINPNLLKETQEYTPKVKCLGYRGSSAYDFPWADVGGHLKFYEQLFCTLSKADSVICDDVSTAFWAACSLGKKVSVTETTMEVESIWSGKKKIDSWSNEQALKFVDASLKLKVNEVVDSTKSMQSLAKKHFGWNNINLTKSTIKFKYSRILDSVFEGYCSMMDFSMKTFRSRVHDSVVRTDANVIVKILSIRTSKG